MIKGYPKRKESSILLMGNVANLKRGNFGCFGTSECPRFHCIDVNQDVHGILDVSVDSYALLIS